MKSITLVTPGAGNGPEAYNAPIVPGTAASVLIAAAGLNPEEWQIQLERGGEFISLSGSDDLYSQVADHEKVFATPLSIVVA